MPIGITKETLQKWYEQGVTYADYLEKAGAKAAPWHAVGEQAQLSVRQKELLSSFVRTTHVLVISGVWCGDCSAQGPMLAAIAEASPAIDLRWIDRDEAVELSNMVKINAGNRVPTVLFMAEDFEPVSIFGDRTLSRYRAIAARQLGDTCDIPGIEIPQNEFDATLQEWLNEFERVQLLLRLSGRLRQKHGD
ncbi:MAG: thiol reductase thioredoxin [Phycisphaerae bacterium]|nr:thiol reductase thioredoxin [Phycisphaerae bacterium]|tara:strand:- start:2188 stop:2763 length:576 start_codon:yes stop_codon:yes gene_type:complete